MPEDWDSDEVMTVSVVKASGGSLASTNPQSVGAIENVLIGWNSIPILPFQLEQGVEYRVIVANEERQYGLVFDEFSLEAPSTQRLIFSYRRTPATMLYEDSFCEMPGEFLSALYSRAKMILHEKFNSDGVSPQLRKDYEIELKKCSDNLLIRQEEGPFIIDQETGLEQDYSPGAYRWARDLNE